MEGGNHTRRDVIKGVGAVAGALNLVLDPLFAAPAPSNPFPQLNDRARGWLRFLYQKAVTKDDWTSQGKPNEWWDQYTAPGILSYPRFDLNESTYDPASGTLNVATYAATPSRRGAATTFRVTKLPNARKVKMFVDGKPFKRFHPVGPNTILIDCDIDSHYYRIVTGYRDTVASAEPQPEAHPAVASEKNETFASSSRNGAWAVSLLARAPGCPCCAKG